MRILIVTKRFPPESPATAMLGHELAEELVRAGHQVTVAAGYPQHPYGRLFPGYRRRLVSVEQVNGFRLVRGWHFIHPSPSMLMRSLVMASQCASYFLSVTRSQSPEVVISFDGYPLLGCLTSAFIARRARAKMVSVIYDLYPDIAIELGKLRHPGLIALARRLEALVYRSSDRIVVLSDGFRRTLVHEKGVSPEKVTVIPTWLDVRDISPMPRENAWRREMDIPEGKFVVLYAGTIGLVAGAEVILEAAQQLSDHADIMFLLVGDGYGKDLVAQQLNNLALTNVKLLPFQLRQRLSELQATADVSLVTLAPGRGRTSVPAKVLGYMAAARPVIAAIDEDCDTAEMIRQANCGKLVPAGNGVALAQAILDYYNCPEDRHLSGENGLKYFLENFQKGDVVNNYVKLIEILRTSV